MLFRNNKRIIERIKDCVKLGSNKNKISALKKFINKRNYSNDGKTL